MDWHFDQTFWPLGLGFAQYRTYNNRVRGGLHLRRSWAHIEESWRGPVRLKYTMREERPAKVVAEESDSEKAVGNAAMQPTPSSVSEPTPDGNETVDLPPPTYPRRERLRARQALQSVGAKTASQHKSRKAHHAANKPSPLLLGCVAAAALATAGIGWWFKRRKLKRKHQDVRHLLQKCKLSPAEAVLTAVPAPPLLSTTFVTTAA